MKDEGTGDGMGRRIKKGKIGDMIRPLLRRERDTESSPCRVQIPALCLLKHKRR